MSNIISIRPKEVAFSQYSDLTFIPKDNFEFKWYSAQEKQSILQAVARDAIQLSREIRGNASSKDISPEQLCKCVGIDALVNRGLARRMIDHRRAHIEAMLSEQRLQQDQGVHFRENDDAARIHCDYGGNPMVLVLQFVILALPQYHHMRPSNSCR